MEQPVFMNTTKKIVKFTQIANYVKINIAKKDIERLVSIGFAMAVKGKSNVNISIKTQGKLKVVTILTVKR